MDYYENTHTPLADTTFPMLQEVCTCRRNYVMHDHVVIPSPFSGEVNYDVVTESIFKDKECFDRFMQEASDPEIAAPHREDEANLFDLESMRFFFVEMYSSEAK